ncbi:MAG: allantoinase AllB [Bacteroidota bacterium]
MPDFAIHSYNTVIGNNLENATVIISNGKILDVLAGFAGDTGCEVIDVHYKVLMPGVIDPHVHINEPGRTLWEGFDSATKAAIAGGITTLIEMPLNASPVTTTASAFKLKLEAAQNNLHTNCGFWGGIVPGNAGEIEPLIQMGVLGFKAFLTHSGIDEFPNVTEADLHFAMPVIAKHELPLLVHCELSDTPPDGIFDDPASYQQYLASRPRSWEDDAIAMMIRLCEQYHCRVHIVHLSSSNSLEQIKTARQKGLPLTVETAQHYLYFNAEGIGDRQVAFKCAPPIREKSNNELLWQSLKDAVIDFVATDHSPAPPEMKQTGSGDFTTAWGGIASLQFALPALWTAAKLRGFSIVEMSNLLSKNPAKLAGLQICKGDIAVGFDADLVVWNPDESFEVVEDGIHHKHTITPYLHETLFGVIEQTYLAGTKVYDNGIFTLLKNGKIIKQPIK